MADDPKPTSNTASTTTKPKLSKEDMMKRAADMIYRFGSSQYGEPGVGNFKSSQAGLVTWGTHRDGRKGILLAGKFFPTSNASTTTTTTTCKRLFSKQLLPNTTKIVMHIFNIGNKFRKQLWCSNEDLHHLT